MSIIALTAEPSSLFAGDSINWQITVADYPASAGWTLKYNAVGSSGRFALSGAADGDQHIISAASAVTGAYPPGIYSLIKYVTNGTDQITLERLPLTVLANLAAATTASDTRTANEIVLDAIDAAIAGSASTDQKRIRIDNTDIERFPRAELQKLRNDYALAVWRERNPGQLAPSINISIRDSRYGS